MHSMVFTKSVSINKKNLIYILDGLRVSNFFEKKMLDELFLKKIKKNKNALLLEIK